MSKQSETNPKRFWVVMKAYDFNALSIGGFELSPPPSGPHRFLPAFNTKAEAVAFEGSDEFVYEMVTVEKDKQ